MEEIPIIKDITFWHILATSACGLLYRMLAKYHEKIEKNFEKIEGTFENITQILNSVVSENKTQQLEIDQHEKRIEKLEGKL